MFWNKKSPENRFIIAIKDYANIIKAIKEGTIFLPFEKEVYLKLLENHGEMVNNLSGLNKFIKTHNKDKSEVMHFWEGLIVQGYTLVDVEYVTESPSLERLCNGDSIKYVCSV